MTTPVLWIASASTVSLGGTVFKVNMVNLPIVLPMALASLVLLIAVPWAAARGKLHIPGYVGLGFLTFVLALLLGRIAGARTITGTTAGVLLSVVFFLLIAAAAGCVIALFFYRQPPEA